MRYDDWDVILFPRDSHVPMQEFRTACYSFSSNGSQMPTLSCYIKSLPPVTPFRISVHSWTIPPRPSCIIESHRRSSQKVVFRVQVIVDGVKTSDSFFDVGSKWPQEISHDKRHLKSLSCSTGTRAKGFEFPPFSQSILIQTTLDTQSTKGRINVVLSEQLICESNRAGELDLGTINDIVCFSFQHAPQDILEQTGISWPISNPLYLPRPCQRASIPLRSIEPNTTGNIPEIRHGHVTASPLAHLSHVTFARPQDSQPARRPGSHPPPLSHFPKPLAGNKGSVFRMMRENRAEPRYDHKYLNFDPWPNPRTGPAADDLFLGDNMYHPSRLCEMDSPWIGEPIHYHGTRQEKDKQIMDDTSPDVQPLVSSRSNASQRNSSRRQLDSLFANEVPKRSRETLLETPSTTLPHKGSYSTLDASAIDPPGKPLLDKSSDKIYLKDKEAMPNYSSLSTGKGTLPISRSPKFAAFPYLSHGPSLDFSSTTKLPQRNPSMIAKMPSPDLLSYRHPEQSDIQSSTGSIHHCGTTYAPSPTSDAKSRREPQAHPSPDPKSHELGHASDLLLPTISKPHNRRSRYQHERTLPLPPSKPGPEIVEIIDIDAIDPSPTITPAPAAAATTTTKMYSHTSSKQHKSSTSSIDSTGRIERQLFSALGEELGSFDNQHVDTPSLVEQQEISESLGHANAPIVAPGNNTSVYCTAGDTETTGKRKRRDTLSSVQLRNHQVARSNNGELGGFGELS